MILSLIDVAPVRERAHSQSVLEALDEVVLLFNSRGVVTHASPSIRRRLGHGFPAATGRALGDIVHPDDLRDALRHLTKAGVGGAVRHSMRVRRADAGYVPLECSLTKVSDLEGGEIVVLSGRDGTRATLEERLASVDRRYRAVLSALSEAVLLLDAELRIQEVNDDAVVLLGKAPHEVLARRWFEAVDVEEGNGRPVTSGSGLVIALLADPTPREDWHSIRRGDGQRVLVRCRWTPLDAGPDGSRGYLLTMSDAGGSRTASAAALPQQRCLARTAAGLTPREHEVLQRLADGHDATQIARELDLSLYSVRGHIKSILRKLRAHSQLQAVVVAARRGIVDVAGGDGASR